MKVAKIQFDPRMFDDLPAMVWMVEPNGAPAYFNQALLTFAGYENIARLARDWFGTVHADDQKAYLAAIRQALKSQDSYAVAYRRRNDLGEYRSVTEHGTALRDDTGGFCGFV